ncbi:MAG TPA: TrbI/VirB10 family protein [Terriglobia bacterium]|nr:TrbI/VirB10 family protein [Terriglobia bacterium]
MLKRWFESLLVVIVLATPLAAQLQSAAATPTSPAQPQNAAGTPTSPAQPQNAADTPTSPAQLQNAAASSTSPSKPAISALVVPKDTTIPVELRNSINSQTASVGQAIYCDTIYPITVSNRIIIPAGSWVKGEVTQVVRPGRVKGRAQIGLRFLEITLPNGTTRSLRATLSGFGGNGKEGFSKRESKVEGQSSKGEDAGKIAETTITGAEIGTIAGVGDHDVGKGLGIGSAVGAAGGLIWVLATRGKEIVLPSGTSLELQLSVPLSFYEDEVESPRNSPSGPALPPRDPGPGE